ncbi:MAG: LD-carboxypeptidase [Bacteroidota bacterium]
MILPEMLKSGDAVGIVAPSRVIKPNQIERAEQIFSRWGLDVRKGSCLFESYGYFSGTDRQRLDDLQHFIHDPSIRAIFCARGGYGVTRIIDQLDLGPLTENPKWFIGFSDITALHLALANIGIVSVHGLMPVQFDYFDADKSIESLRKLLFEGKGQIDALGSALNRAGRARAPIIGGNLSLIADSLGTASEIDAQDKILFLEEIDEYLYKIDRMLTQLKRAGKFETLKGLVIGDFSQMKDTQIPFGQSLEEIMVDKVKEYNYPLGFGFPIGHEIPNYSIPLMSEVDFEVKGHMSQLAFAL